MKVIQKDKDLVRIQFSETDILKLKKGIQFVLDNSFANDKVPIEYLQICKDLYETPCEYMTDDPKWYHSRYLVKLSLIIGEPAEIILEK